MQTSITTPTPGNPIYNMDYSKYILMSSREFQDLFRIHPAIVVSGRPVRLKCDLASLEEWGCLDELRVMHGKISLPTIDT